MAEDNGEEEIMYMPKESNCIRFGCLQKKSINTKGIVWDKRLVSLTDEMIMFTRVEDTDRTVIDYINLVDVVECELKDDEDLLSDFGNDDHRTNSQGGNQDQRMREVIFRTYENSRNCGRSYIYRSNYQDAGEWEAEVDQAVKNAKDRAFEDKMQQEYGHSIFEMGRARWKHITKTNTYQYTVMAITLIGFIVDAIEAQLVPATDLQTKIFLLFDILITSCFCIDLFSNLFAHSSRCFRDFFSRFSNWFDVAIVTVSVSGISLEMFMNSDAGSMQVFRILRVLKVLPMIKKLASLWRLVQSIGSCLLPMAQAFFILFVITLLYSVLGVHLFSHRNPEFFRDLSTALFTLHQVVTGDSWSLAVARSLYLPGDNGVKKTDPAIAFFFVSYVLIGNILLLNVVVAVLLDEFLANVQREKERAAALVEAEASKQRITGVLDPITSTLTNYQDADDLAETMDTVYKRLDADGSGGLNFDEFKEGIRRLPGTSRIHMTHDDFEIITE